MRLDDRRKVRRLAAALLLATAVASCGGVNTSEVALWGDDIAPSELPPAVVKTIRERFPNAQIYAAERERIGDRVWYEVRIRDRGGQYELRVMENGVLDEVSQEDA